MRVKNPIVLSQLLKRRLITSTLAALCLFHVQAQANPGRPSPFSLQASWVTTDDADVGHATLGRDMYLFDAKGMYSLDERWSVGWSAGYDVLDYRWQNATKTMFRGEGKPWDSISRYDLGVSLAFRNGDWMYLLSPMLQYAWADAASSSRSQSLGLMASGLRWFDNSNMLGVGLIYLDDIDERRVVPFLALQWQLTERLSLSNPFDAGFSGPAGLELIYRSSPIWDLGVGGSKRKQRFLLNDDGRTVEIDEWVTFTRLGWQIGRKVNLNAYAGWIFDSQMALGSGEKEKMSAEGAVAVSFEVQF